MFPAVLKRREDMTADIARFELVAPEGSELPAFEAGAHVDVVIAPEYLRQYSLAGDPADRTKYVLGLQAEANGRGGSKLAHRVFREGRRVFVSRPIQQFPLEEGAAKTFLFAGGIGVTPLLTMAHRLHALGREFVLHYSVRRRGEAGFLADIAAAPWRDRARAARQRGGHARRLRAAGSGVGARVPSLRLRRRALHGRGVRGRTGRRAGRTRRSTANTSACPSRRTT